ncbi:MAG TPA: DUF421 domain-containing protein [Candidatus Faecicola pullistercoris]|nr:DUF421 domain-containing protein [Candidatus Faecicola pullistercoris]
MVKSALLYIVLLIVMRLMGKRQIGQLQPFEFSITLVIAELACLPMGDPSIPLIYGIIPVFTLFIVHITMNFIAVKSPRFRKILNGKPLIIINGGNIDTRAVKSADMDSDDISEALRIAGYFFPEEIEFAVLETNGSLSVMPKYANSPYTPSDAGLSNREKFLPYTVIAEGRLLKNNLIKLGLSEQQIELQLQKLQLIQKQVFLMTVTQDKTLFVQPYLKPCYMGKLE